MKAKDTEELPSPEEAGLAFVPASNSALAQVRKRLQTLAQKPPQVIHFEGGTPTQRHALGLWWAALLNCQTQGGDVPCLKCSSCLRIGANMHSDVILMDGRVESIKIDDVRALRPLLGEKPRFAEKRVVFFAQAPSLGIASANSLLKVLEEPNPDTCFVFTMPQRERLLPTLLSRGFVLTLPWPRRADAFGISGVGENALADSLSSPATPDALAPILHEWEEALAAFLIGGKSWLAKSGVKGSLDASLAQEIIAYIQACFVHAATLREKRRQAAGAPLSPLEEGSGLPRVLARFSPQACFEAQMLLEQSQEALLYMVSPALVLDTLVMELYRAARSKAV